MKGLLETFSALGFTIKLVVWVFVAAIGFFISALFSRKSGKCPYSAEEGKSEDLHTLNFS